MNGTIYDFSALPRTAAPTPEGSWAPPRGREVARAPVRVGLISNPRSRRNREAGATPRPDGVLAAAPHTRAELQEVIRRFAVERIDLLVIDGGDGTVRDVLTLAGDAWGMRWPRVAVLPSGKTNALAADLGLPAGWTVEQALAAAANGSSATRAPVEIERVDGAGATLRGFLFGAGAFVGATELAQRTHKAGAFNGVAVGLALSWAVAQTAFGPATSPWRRGEPMRVAYGARSVALHGYPLETEGGRYLMLASTLERMPLGLKPFGRVRPGLKTLLVDAPPRRIGAMFAAGVAGSEARWLDRLGYHRVDAPALDLELGGDFILDGEQFPGGRYRIREGAPLSFVTP